MGGAGGGYSDYASSLHLYGQDVAERGVDKYLERGEETALASAYDSEIAAELFVIPHLAELKDEEYWRFPEGARAYMQGLIDDLQAGKYPA